MRLFMVLIGVLGLMGTALAQPVSVSGECWFRGATKDPGLRRCQATFVFEGFQSGSDSNLRVVCPGLGKGALVYDDDAEFRGVDDTIVIEPAGSETLPAISIPIESFTCSPEPRRVEAKLELPERFPYRGLELEGRCVTVPVCGGG